MINFYYVGTFLISSSNCPPTPSSAISHYQTYLKYVYESSPISPDTKWPPTPGKEFVSLSVVEGQNCRDQYIGHTLQGNIKKVLKHRQEISIEQILEPIEGQPKLRLVLMEGAPGIGKSTLAWELCRKWEEFSCMKQYSLVVLLRLREEIVQKISSVDKLFCKYEDEGKKSLVQEVSKNQGNGVLFVLDGFDELPKTLQKEGFLLDLIKGSILPASTVLVTSRPSATAELLTSCRPQIQKHIEILGFTQESVEAYASSIFSSEPEALEKFKAYISASKNPAINSLMYVPLNAAIIVEIYRNCTSESYLPHTLTELYTQLCLTLLNRYLKIHHSYLVNGVEKFEDLPADLYQQFLHLSQVAYDGIKSEEVIFHTSLPSLGFLDAVSALYGGGGVSYNFLHLTVQEFFAAYHISHLGSSGLEVFKQHCVNKRWGVVWRFVAGLTKFKHYVYEGQHLFSGLSMDDKKLLFIQYLFEAQTILNLKSLFKELISQDMNFTHCLSYTALDLYALGYCLANFHTGVFSKLRMERKTNLSPFISGLMSNMPGIRHQSPMSHCADVGELKSQPFRDLTVLSLKLCRLTNADLIHLTELIPHMAYLKKLVIHGIEDYDGNKYQHDLLKIVQQLPHSNVVSLDISDTGFCRMLRDSPHVYSSALKQLVGPSSWKLEELAVGDGEDVDDSGVLASLVSAPSSLKSLGLCGTSLSSHVSHLKDNTCLTELDISYSERWSKELFPYINTILKCNKTLQHLNLTYDLLPRGITFDAIETISKAISGNSTLQTLEIETEHSIEVREKRHKLDKRINVIVKL